MSDIYSEPDNMPSIKTVKWWLHCLVETGTCPTFSERALAYSAQEYINQLETDKRRLMGFCMVAYSELEQVSPNYEFLALLEAELPRWTDDELAKARKKAKEISEQLNWCETK